MVTFSRGENGKKVDSRWHQSRQDAREIAFSVNEFSDEEITKYDLDTARITGDENDRTYTYNRSIDIMDSNNTDVRELDDR